MKIRVHLLERGEVDGSGVMEEVPRDDWLRRTIFRDLKEFLEAFRRE